MAETASGNAGVVVEQRIFVMRHGERQDTRDPSWKKTAERPYDTPITSRGKLEAFRLSERRFKGKDVKIIYSSPFLRCLQTAAQASSALGIEGLCVSNSLVEIMTSLCGMQAQPKVPCDDIESYEVHIKEHDSRDFPKYPETSKEAIQRYEAEYKRLADLHWPDNLLIVTHEYGVMSAMKLGGGSENVEAVYCGSVELIRREQAQHEWSIVEYHGVYQYENPID